VEENDLGGLQFGCRHYGCPQAIVFYYMLGNHDPEGGLKIRKIYKKLGMSSNPCSHDLANCHAKEPRESAVPRLSISETGN